MLILGWPTIGSRLFVNFLAIFWLVSGLMSLQWGLSMHQKRGGIVLIIQAFQMRTALKARPVV
jgi:hypothetical protein